MLLGALRRGDRVRVRSAAEILPTLNERGQLDGLPFMPEMVAMCGSEYTVSARAEKICDTITFNGSMRMTNVVLLDDLRCNGSAHGGCQAECRIYWKEAWLKRVSTGANPGAATDDDGRLVSVVENAAVDLSDDGKPRYRCQATEALRSSVPLRKSDVGSYVREYTSGNVSLGRWALTMTRAVTLEGRKQLGLLPIPAVKGETGVSPKLPELGLSPGDWVRVKSKDEIAATLNDKGRNRGLWFDREQLAHCGKVYRVHSRVQRIIDERNGEMLDLPNDCVTLEGAICEATTSLGRWFCPRGIYPYWREGWLERVDDRAP